MANPSATGIRSMDMSIVHRVFDMEGGVVLNFSN